MTLQSGVLTSPADAMLGNAIAETLSLPTADRAAHFEKRTREIEAFMTAHPAERPWTRTVYTGTDESRIFRGGIDHSLVIDPSGRLWRACVIDTLTPLYEQMRDREARS